MKNPIKGIISELKQTTWLTPKKLVGLVAYTIVICGIIALIILGLDIGLARIRDIILS